MTDPKDSELSEEEWHQDFDGLMLAYADFNDPATVAISDRLHAHDQALRTSLTAKDSEIADLRTRLKMSLGDCEDENREQRAEIADLRGRLKATEKERDNALEFIEAFGRDAGPDEVDYWKAQAMDAVAAERIGGRAMAEAQDRAEQAEERVKRLGSAIQALNDDEETWEALPLEHAQRLYAALHQQREAGK